MKPIVGIAQLSKDNGRGIMSFGLAWNTQQILEETLLREKEAGRVQTKYHKKTEVRHSVQSFPELS